MKIIFIKPKSFIALNIFFSIILFGFFTAEELLNWQLFINYPYKKYLFIIFGIICLANAFRTYFKTENNK